MTAPPQARPRGGKPSSLRYYQDGPPASVDLTAWRLTVCGLGVTPVALSIDDLRAMARVTENRRYVCVCNWSTRELWSGVLLSTLLTAVGWGGSGDGLYLKQTSVGTPEKGVYESTLPLGPALRRRALLADSIERQPLSLDRGFPLRFWDFGLYAYKSVKGLGRLEITDEFCLGEWEMRAGYALEGEIQPKRYRFCDLGRHHFLDSPGEVTDV